jgi:hypothetical protein
MSQSSRDKFIDLLLKQKKQEDNSKFGEFILQTNEVQFYISVIIFFRTFNPTKQLLKDLQSLTLGQLIKSFRMCIRSETELALINNLEIYNQKRNTLAHKMFSHKRLSLTECKIQIEKGNKILSILSKLLKH